VDTSGLEVSDRRRRAIDTLAMGTNAKLQFQLNRSLLDVDWTGAFRSDDPEFGTWDSTYGQSEPHPETPVITIYNGGRAGAGYPTDVPHDTAPPAIIDAALDALARGVTDIHDALLPAHQPHVARVDAARVSPTPTCLAPAAPLARRSRRPR
jgi:hypothetical protein